MTDTLKVTQDGGDFYVHLDGQPEPDVYTCPHPVTDYDLDGAALARQWFVDHIAWGLVEWQ